MNLSTSDVYNSADFAIIWKTDKDMYCQYFGFKEKPFNVTSDPSFFFFSHRHKEAFSHLAYGVNQRKGIMVITGEIGTGKTTLCRFFLNQLGPDVKTAFILNPYFSEAQLFNAILRDFGIYNEKRKKSSFIWSLNDFLLKQSKIGNNVVLIIDEAQNLKPNQLEQIRLLSNLETQKDKLIQIVLVGQPELNRRLNLHSLRQLQQRIAIRCHITPLEKQDIKNYIEHRIKIAASRNTVVFSEGALELITDFSGGTPRLINIICDRALLAAFTSESRQIDSDIMQRCLEELGTYFAKQS